MMNSIGHLVGSTITASDGEIGRIKQAFFDDQTWTVRYLVVDTGSWLSEREVLISPYSVRQPLGAEKILPWRSHAVRWRTARISIPTSPFRAAASANI